jgi:hypothetical protein
MADRQHGETSFYVALPSDSSTQYFPENTLSGYTTKLPREIQLDGSWECGVSEVRYPLTFYNVEDEMIFIKAKGTFQHQIVRFSPGYYTTNDVLKKINPAISKFGGDIKIGGHSGKIRMTTGNYPLYMSQNLHDFLGHEFEPKPKNRVFERITTYNGKHVVDTHRGFDTLFIYCDTLTPRIVGDTNTALLVTLPNGSKRTFGDTVNSRFSKIRYFPVAKRRFHTIRIDIRTDIGTPVKFEGGKVFVELHFRKVINA